MGKVCPVCGKDYDKGWFAFQWCPSCTAYICRKCLGKKDNCPSCKGQTKVETGPAMTLMTGGVLLLVGLMFLGMSFHSLIAKGPDYSNIADANEGQLVKLHGTVNSTDQIVIVIKETDDVYRLQTYSLFRLFDSSNASILVDVGNCGDFHYSRHYHRDSDSYTYENGDDITVVGSVRARTDGNLTVYADRIFPRTRDPDDMSYTVWIIVPICLIGAIVISAGQGQKYWHRRQHARYLELHPPTRITVPGEEGAVRDSSGRPVQMVSEAGVEWHENLMYHQFDKYGYWSGAIMIATLALFIYLYFTWLSGDLGAFLLIVLLVEMFPAAFILVPWGYKRMIATRAGISSKGIHFRYGRGDVPWYYRKFVKWEDIQRLNGDYKYPANKVMFNSPNSMTLWIDEQPHNMIMCREIYRIVSAEFSRRFPDRPVDKPLPEEVFKKETEIKKKEVMASGGIEWIPNKPEHRKRMRMLGWSLIAVALVIAIWGFTLLPSPNAMGPWMAAFMVGMIAMFPFASKSTTPEAVAFTKDAFLVKKSFTRPTPDKDEYIAWDSVKTVNPLFSDNLYLKLKQKEFELIYSVDPALLSKFIETVDRLYLEAHPEDRTAQRKGQGCEYIPNNARPMLKKMLVYPAVILLVLMPVMYLVGGLWLGWGLYSLIISMYLITFGKDIHGKHYGQFKRAPVSVGISSEGIHAEYGGAPVPHCSFSFLSWKEINAIGTPEDVFEERYRSGSLSDTQARKHLAVRKKSGTSFILGPIDKELADRIMERAPRTKK
jgi:predicted nucleic acid-binding Zn ribbon protein